MQMVLLKGQPVSPSTVMEDATVRLPSEYAPRSPAHKYQHKVKSLPLRFGQQHG